MADFPPKPIFLRAEWRYLINLTYRVPAEKLLPLLPKGLQPDWWEGHAHVSLVAFDFLETKVKGIKIPFHINFPEINLRYYVRTEDGQRNGVMFVKELVPKWAIAKVANWAYNEPYQRRAMRSEIVDLGAGKQKIRHEVKMQGNWNWIEMEIGKPQGIPEPGTPDHFFKEHDLGFGVRRNGKVLAYRVDHPKWDIYEVRSVDLGWNFEAAYGPEWAFLNDSEPRYQLCAVGSPVSVYHPFPLADLPR